MLIYGTIAVVGFILLLSMLLIGEIFGADHDVGAHDAHVGHIDADHGGPSIFSVRIMAAFVTAFGVGGLVARYYDFPHPAASGVGTLCGLALAGIVYQFARYLYSQQASSGVRMNSLVGLAAEVSVAIPEHGIGQVTTTYGGERSEHLARGVDGRAVQRGAGVVITELRGDAVIVKPADATPSGGSR
jgi:membrane protein implicated in regulation of membrane protease activity